MNWFRRLGNDGHSGATWDRAITGTVIVRVLLGGFGLVILLLLAAGLLGVRNISSIRATASDLLEEQVRTSDLLDAVLREQRTINAIYFNIARRPEALDRDQLLGQLVASDKELADIVEAASDEPDQGLWKQLFSEASSFSDESRKILATENPVTGPSTRLLETHRQVLTLVDRLVEVESRRSKDLQQQLESLSGNLLRQSSVLLGGGLVLALLFAFVTVRLTGQLVRQMEWQTGELSRVSWQLLEKQETTARRFSHELHDELGQSLSAVKANLTPLAGASGPGRDRVLDSIRLVDEAIRNVRELSQLLRPTILDDFGLAASLRWLCDRVQQRTGVDVRVQLQCRRTHGRRDGDPSVSNRAGSAHQCGSPFGSDAGRHPPRPAERQRPPGDSRQRPRRIVRAGHGFLGAAATRTGNCRDASASQKRWWRIEDRFCSRRGHCD